MTCAVEIPWMHTICFVFARPEDRPGMNIVEGAWIDIPPNISEWPHGAKSPEQVLCQDIHDPLHYKLFKYRDEVAGSGFRDTGMNFGGTFSKDAWDEYLGRLAVMESVYAIPDELDM